MKQVVALSIALCALSGLLSDVYLKGGGVVPLRVESEPWGPQNASDEASGPVAHLIWQSDTSTVGRWGGLEQDAEERLTERGIRVDPVPLSRESGEYEVFVSVHSEPTEDSEAKVLVVVRLSLAVTRWRAAHQYIVTGTLKSDSEARAYVITREWVMRKMDEVVDKMLGRNDVGDSLGNQIGA